ncbi:MAG: efflux RND transporter periplasmic adaptor subunit, partial [Acidobacteriota bacterium]
ENETPRLYIPEAALRDGAVLVIEDGVAVSRTVETGVVDGTRVEIVDGVRAGEQVILDSAIAEGARVRAKG